MSMGKYFWIWGYNFLYVITRETSWYVQKRPFISEYVKQMKNIPDSHIVFLVYDRNVRLW